MSVPINGDAGNADVLVGISERTDEDVGVPEKPKERYSRGYLPHWICSESNARTAEEKAHPGDTQEAKRGGFGGNRNVAELQKIHLSAATIP